MASAFSKKWVLEIDAELGDVELVPREKFTFHYLRSKHINFLSVE